MKPEISPCTECGESPSQEHLPPDDVEPGGLYPCWFCGAIRVFAPDGTLREPDEEERRLIDSHGQVAYMRRMAAMRRSFTDWCVASGVTSPATEDVFRFIMAGGLVSPDPVSRPDWARSPHVLIARQADLMGESGPGASVMIHLERPREPEGPGPAELVLTAEEFAQLSGYVTLGWRQRAADRVEALAACYPKSLFGPGDRVARALRHAYRQAAAIVREGSGE